MRTNPIQDMILSKNTSFPRLEVDDDKCTGCGRCVQTCPIQLLMLNAEKKMPQQ